MKESELMVVTKWAGEERKWPKGRTERVPRGQSKVNATRAKEWKNTEDGYMMKGGTRLRGQGSPRERGAEKN